MKHVRSIDRRGFTLIEVVAALAILGVLLTAASVSRGRMARQDRQSRDRLAAVALLATWADRHWAERARWAAWAEGEGPDGLPPLLEQAVALADGPPPSGLVGSGGRNWAAVGTGGAGGWCPFGWRWSARMQTATRSRWRCSMCSCPTRRSRDQPLGPARLGGAVGSKP